LVFAQASLDWDPPILCYPLLLGWQAHPTMPSLFSTRLRCGFANFFAWAGLKPQSSGS
jgi:hypothetical protein